MKLLSNELKKLTEFNTSSDNKLCHCISTNEGYRRLETPMYAKDMECHACGSKVYHLWMVDKENRAWMCGANCAASKLPNSMGQGVGIPKVERSLQWSLFCEINGIGDLHHGVKFENIQQSKGKLDFLLSFGTKPCDIIIMQGSPGSGKTYSAMGACELFTRKNSSCIFTTQKQMLSNWLDTFKPSDRFNGYIDRVMGISLLVVDDFGTGEPNPKFLEFFMEVINNRMQWSDRGTIITTNLVKEKLSLFCGDALTDRLKMGQLLVYNEPSRRIKKPL